MNEDKSRQESNFPTATASSSSYLSKLNIFRDEKKEKLRSWLGKIVKINIVDGRCLVGKFVCTDRDGNTILENTWEYTDDNIDRISKNIDIGNNEVRVVGSTLIAIKDMVSISVMATAT